MCDWANPSFEVLKVSALPAACWRQKAAWFSLLLLFVSYFVYLKQRPEANSGDWGAILLETPVLWQTLTLCTKERSPLPLSHNLSSKTCLLERTLLCGQTRIPVLPLMGWAALVKLLYFLELVLFLCRMGIIQHISRGCCRCHSCPGALVWILTLSFPSWVALYNLLKASVPQFPHLKMETIINTYFLGILWESSEINKNV